MASITLRLPKELSGELKKACRRQNRSASDILRESLRRYLVAEQLREIREALRPYAEAVGVLTDEDVFKAAS